MNGVLVVDKPHGLTSFDVVRQVRQLCKTRRVGHAGTLDPLATGVLPVAVGWATRLVEYLMEGEKTYQATLKLGSSTDTQDSEGQTLEVRDWQHVDRAALDKVLCRFSGQVNQLPPMYSALKKDGQPLYLLARKGIEVLRQTRAVCIESLLIDAFNPPYVTFTVRCSKGTYIRTLCHDIGVALGCGAHMTSLRRLACGPFDVSASYTLDALRAFADEGRPLPLISPADAMAGWPALVVDGPVLSRLLNGVSPTVTELDVAGLAPGDRARFLNGEVLVAVARYTPGRQGKRPGDFEILKVFPMVDDEG
jgi:tRNA pseudouridine55 synthase